MEPPRSDCQPDDVTVTRPLRFVDYGFECAAHKIHPEVILTVDRSLKAKCNVRRAGDATAGIRAARGHPQNPLGDCSFGMCLTGIRVAKGAILDQPCGVPWAGLFRPC